MQIPHEDFWCYPQFLGLYLYNLYSILSPNIGFIVGYHISFFFIIVFQLFGYLLSYLSYFYDYTSYFPFFNGTSPIVCAQGPGSSARRQQCSSSPRLSLPGAAASSG